MPTREEISRLTVIQNWDKIPKKNKKGKNPTIYIKNGRKYIKMILIAYQDDQDVKDMCGDNYKGNVLLRYPGGAYKKVFKGKDQIYIDWTTVYIKDMKKMVRGWRVPIKKVKENNPPSSRKKKSKKKNPRVLLDF